MSLNLETLLFKVNVGTSLFMNKVILYFSKKTMPLYSQTSTQISLCIPFIIYFSLFFYSCQILRFNYLCLPLYYFYLFIFFYVFLFSMCYPLCFLAQAFKLHLIFRSRLGQQQSKEEMAKVNVKKIVYIHIHKDKLKVLSLQNEQRSKCFINVFKYFQSIFSMYVDFTLSFFMCVFCTFPSITCHMWKRIESRFSETSACFFLYKRTLTHLPLSADITLQWLIQHSRTKRSS